MNPNIIGAVIAFAVGVGISAVNYLISRYILKKSPSKYATAQIVKQLVQIAYLFALFMLSEYTPWDRMWMLVGGCMGITLPMIIFTPRLVRLNDSLRKKEENKDG